jgi:AraC-like DNA-binding protein
MSFGGKDYRADPSAKIIDVAMAAGYETPQHFSRAFRQLAGVSPSAYRRSKMGMADP